MKMVSCFALKPQCNVLLPYSVTGRSHLQIFVRRPTILTEEWIVVLFVNRYGRLPGNDSFQKHLCLPSLIRDRLYDLLVRGPGYRTDTYCVSCEVRTEFIYVMYKKVGRLCGLVVRVPGYRSRGPGSISGTTGNGVRSASWVHMRSYLKDKVVAPA
jgi:hypothetical protein